MRMDIGMSCADAARKRKRPVEGGVIVFCRDPCCVLRRAYHVACASSANGVKRRKSSSQRTQCMMKASEVYL